MTLLCSCGPSIQSGAGEGVALRVEPGEVSAGDSVTLVLANGTAGAIGYNLCTSGLERQVDDDWQPAIDNDIWSVRFYDHELGRINPRKGDFIIRVLPMSPV
jgi:hypothetical protein